ncbi:DegT/DnrJ/EryC1/StrS family aminotransferase [Nesterenkonia natronophila]|uniref:Aminotransferase class I/II-fold pyridoxal phosphate-dependent enzyme n=1 Tax=Nesterenkonia natronophila TaxID=2174932 RepID=A0A3A4F175_9MICC|nr:aminotransferase class I/II-fold pyridoxal phosphate-dependent enzyme [Nesterenkonia natronophila]RJN31596.1 aminotransferase class I/II-fold pyridoxal phosphate-dependent enzyme [Nesterenkonia natronophila]
MTKNLLTVQPPQTSASAPIHLSAPDVGPVEECAVLSALRSGWVAPAGPDLDAFEASMAQRVGVRHAVGLASGTAALHLGLLALGVQPGHVVITSTLTFAATANAIVYTGATPYFVDVDPSTGNMEPSLLEQALVSLHDAGEVVGAIIPVDLLGKAANYTAIETIAGHHGVPVLADAAESLGATHRDRPAASFGQAAVLSFNGNKIMTTSGGGMLLTDDGELAARVRYLSTQARQPVAHYEHTEIGFNYRLSNLLAALGRAQLTRLETMIARRREIRQQYRAWCAATPGTQIFGAAGDDQDNCWLTAILIDPDVHSFPIDELSRQMAHHGIETRRIWKPMHLQPVFVDSPSLLTGAAAQLFETGLALPSGSALGEYQIQRVLQVLTEFVGGQ